ncbi:MAG: hypothetical protein ACRDAX_00295 [Propionibacteriaceae bacterium]
MGLDLRDAIAISRRGLLAGAIASACASCSASKSDNQATITRTPLHIERCRAETIISQLDTVFHGTDKAKFLELLGPRSDKNLWEKIWEGVHRVPTDNYGIKISPAANLSGYVTGLRQIELTVPAHFEHRLQDVDDKSILQPITLTITQTSYAKSPLLERVTFEDHEVQPWEYALLSATMGEQILFQYRSDDTTAAMNFFPAIETGVARARRIVPVSSDSKKLSVLWGWSEDAKNTSPELYGGRSLIDAAGVCFQLETGNNGVAQRIVLTPSNDFSRIEKVSAHEATHAFMDGWQEASNKTRVPTWLAEGLATWVEFDTLSGLRSYRIDKALGSLDEAVKTVMFGDQFYQGEVSSHYALACFWCAFVEDRFGTEMVWQIAKSAYRRGDLEELPAAIGMTAAESMQVFSSWVKAW